MHARVCGAIWIAAAVFPGAAIAEQAGVPDPAAPPAAAPPVAAGPDATAPATSPLITEPEPRRELPPNAVFSWEPFGYLRLQYLAVQNDPNVAFVGRDDGFELQNARVGARGKIRGRVGFTLAFDGAVDERLQVNTPDGKLRVGLRDAFADVQLTDALFGRSGAVTVRGGFFQAWVDPEALVGDTERELVDHPIESRGMRATEGFQTPGLTPGRSLGAAIRIEPDRTEVGFGFELAVQNGADEFASNNDNDKPAISAAVVVRLPRDGWVMGAARYNPRSVGDLPFRQDETDQQATAGLRLAVGPIVLGGGAIVQRTTFPTTGGPAQRAFGGHAQVMVALPIKLPVELGYRFGILDPSSLITTDRVMEHSAAAMLAVPGYRMRFQLQLTHVIEQAARELANDRAQLAVELSL